jgi:hypothetical protein
MLISPVCGVWPPPPCIHKQTIFNINQIRHFREERYVLNTVQRPSSTQCLLLIRVGSGLSYQFFPFFLESYFCLPNNNDILLIFASILAPVKDLPSLSKGHSVLWVIYAERPCLFQHGPADIFLCYWAIPWMATMQLSRFVRISLRSSRREASLNFAGMLILLLSSIPYSNLPVNNFPPFYTLYHFKHLYL